MSTFRLFTTSGYSGEIGGTGTVFGTSGVQHITVANAAGTVSFDPSFAAGNDFIRLNGAGSAWQIKLVGSNVQLSDGDTLVNIPVGTAGLQIAFADGIRVLSQSNASGITLGGQAVSATFAAVSGTITTTTLPGGTDPAAAAKLYLGTDAEVTAGGRLTVFGTAAGEEVVTLTSGNVTFDPSFATGGDTIHTSQNAAAFTATRSGSNVLMDSATLDYTVGAGVAGAALSFADGLRTLAFDGDLGTVLFGAQTMLTGLANKLEASGDAPKNMVVFWNDTLLDVIAAVSASPPAASRAMAIMGIAVNDVIASIGNDEGYWLDLRVDGSTDLNAAVAYASYAVLKALFPAQGALIDQRLADVSIYLGSGESREEAREVGTAIGNAIVALRQFDGATDVVAFTPGSEIGDWVPTTTGGSAILPQWATVEPFALTTQSQFRAAPPPSPSTLDYAAALNEVKLLGSATNSGRTADQTEIARFWVDGGATYTPPGHWNLIAQIAAEQTGATTAQNAKTFAVLGVALADAAIAAWDTKYEYAFWRPITAIRSAGSDGNAQTAPDVNWTPLLSPTPMHPTYVSGHSTFSAAGSAVLTAIFGQDFAFSVTSMDLPGVTRTFDNFDQAALEAGLSRIYGGIHFTFDNTAGYAMGHQVGDWALASFGITAVG